MIRSGLGDRFNMPMRIFGFIPLLGLRSIALSALPQPHFFLHKICKLLRGGDAKKAVAGGARADSCRFFFLRRNTVGAEAKVC